MLGLIARSKCRVRGARASGGKMKKILGSIAVVAALTAGTAAAQTFEPLSGQKEALRADQKRIFAEMFEKPDDLELMFDYALVSIQLEDLEAAISTLERMLIYNRDLPRVHMELGAAYYRLGSYKTAGYYFNNVLGFDNVPPQVVEKAKEFRRAVDQRTQKSVVTVSASVGAVYASNATLGPDDPTVQLFNLPVVLGANDVEQDDVGGRFTGVMSHFLDLDQPDSDYWRTDASVYSLKYADQSTGDLDSFLVRTGPRLSLDDQEFGPKIRPFVEFDHVRSGGDGLYFTGSAGAEYTDTLSDTLSVFGSARGGYRNYISGSDDDLDGPVIRGSFGAAFLPTSDLVFRGTGFAERVFASDGDLSSTELTLRTSATWSYDSGQEFADRLWSLTGFASATYRGFDGIDVQFSNQTGGKAREDADLRFGLRHMAYLEDGVWVAFEADFLKRFSNVDLIKVENFGGAVSLGFDF